MRSLGAALLAASLIAGSAFAQTPSNRDSAPLAPGKPAGVKQALLHHAPIWVWVAGVGFVALGVGLIASGNGNNASVPATTGSSP